MGYMVVRSDEIQRIFIDEMALLIIENTSVSLTASLLNELNKKKVKIIFCNEQHNPSCELVSYYGSHNSSKCIRDQIKWSDDIKALVWQKIIRDKISKQAFVLEIHEAGEEFELLKSYIPQVEIGDVTNREGHAAKVYFNALFGKKFSRDDDCILNSSLDYGYALLLASFNREVHALGRLTQIGIWHDNTFNFFNLSSDLMEAFRPLVDQFVLRQNFDFYSSDVLTTEHKHILLQILECSLMINGSIHKLPNAIKIYTQKILQTLDENTLEHLPYITYV
jgi:CRISPR-associated endonuclease Cas1 subtype II